MTKLELTTALTAKGIPFDPTAKNEVLEALLNGTTTVAIVKPANKTIVLKRQAIRDIKTRSKKNVFTKLDTKTAIKYKDTGFNTYSYEGIVDGVKESLMFNSWEPRFIENFEDNTIYSIELISNVTDEILEANDYGDSARYQTYWEIGSVVTRKEHKQDRQDAKDDKEDARADRMEKLESKVFDIEKFDANPELIKSSGFMESIMNAS